MNTQPLNFAVERTNAVDAGNYYWTAGLQDGREVTFYADEIRFQDGALLAVSKIPSATSNPNLRLALPAGAWTHVYAASIIDGSPICIDHLPEPATEGKES